VLRKALSDGQAGEHHAPARTVDCPVCKGPL
jgi:hypothetical protein